MRYLFVKYEDNWADEMDICGCKIMLPDEWEEYKRKASKIFEEKERNAVDRFDLVCLCVGTNEDICYDDYDEFIDCFTVTEINTAEKEFLEKIRIDKMGIFPGTSYNCLEGERLFD